MFRRNKKTIVMALAIVMLSTTVFANPVIRNIKAAYGSVRIVNEGQDVTNIVNTRYDGAEAFISDGRTYVPIRAVADVLGITVEWDQASRTASFTDPEKAQLRSRIAQLEDQIKKLEEKPASSAEALKELQKKLEKDFDRIDGISVRYSISQDAKGELLMDIYADVSASRDKTDWDKISYRTMENTVKDIVKEVDKSFKDSKLVGKIYTESRYEKDQLQYEFTRNVGKSVDLVERTDRAKDTMKDVAIREVGLAIRDAKLEDSFYKIESKDATARDYNLEVTIELKNDLRTKDKNYLEDELKDAEDYIQREYGSRYRLIVSILLNGKEEYYFDRGKLY